MKKGCLVALVLAIFLAAGAVLFGPRLVEAGMKFLYPQRYAGLVEREAAHLVHTPDVIVPDRDGPFSFCGAEFQIIQTPGHSAGHISTITPDGVC